jgi:hypothetical protein
MRKVMKITFYTFYLVIYPGIDFNRLFSMIRKKFCSITLPTILKKTKETIFV